MPITIWDQNGVAICQTYEKARAVSDADLNNIKR